MKTAKEWCQQLGDDADRVEVMSDAETQAHAEATIRAVQQDALEAAALECDALAAGQRRFLAGCRPIETVVSAAARLAEETAKQDAANIRKLKEQA